VTVKSPRLVHVEAADYISEGLAVNEDGPALVQEQEAEVEQVEPEELSMIREEEEEEADAPEEDDDDVIQEQLAPRKSQEHDSPHPAAAPTSPTPTRITRSMSRSPAKNNSLASAKTNSPSKSPTTEVKPASPGKTGSPGKTMPVSLFEGEDVFAFPTPPSSVQLALAAFPPASPPRTAAAAASSQPPKSSPVQSTRAVAFDHAVPLSDAPSQLRNNGNNNSNGLASSTSSNSSAPGTVGRPTSTRTPATGSRPTSAQLPPSPSSQFLYRNPNRSSALSFVGLPGGLSKSSLGAGLGQSRRTLSKADSEAAVAAAAPPHKRKSSGEGEPVAKHARSTEKEVVAGGGGGNSDVDSKQRIEALKSKVESMRGATSSNRNSSATSSGALIGLGLGRPSALGIQSTIIGQTTSSVQPPPPSRPATANVAVQPQDHQDLPPTASASPELSSKALRDDKATAVATGEDHHHATSGSSQKGEVIRSTVNDMVRALEEKQQHKGGPPPSSSTGRKTGKVVAPAPATPDLDHHHRPLEPVESTTPPGSPPRYGFKFASLASTVAAAAAVTVPSITPAVTSAAHPAAAAAVAAPVHVEEVEGEDFKEDEGDLLEDEEEMQDPDADDEDEGDVDVDVDVDDGEDKTTRMQFYDAEEETEETAVTEPLPRKLFEQPSSTATKTKHLQQHRAPVRAWVSDQVPFRFLDWH
jgi:hypothetical protein